MQTHGYSFTDLRVELLIGKIVLSDMFLPSHFSERYILDSRIDKDYYLCL